MGTVEPVTSTADRYRANASAFTARVEAVPADAWQNPSPCADWTARDVVRHVVDSSGVFLGLVGETLPPAPPVDDDPVAAWRSARDAIQRALDDPAIAQREYDGAFGRTTFERSVRNFLVPDALLHTWDVARATGLDENLDEQACLDALEMFSKVPDEAMRSPGVFGPKIEPPPGADAQTRLLNFTGRRE